MNISGTEIDASISEPLLAAMCQNIGHYFGETKDILALIPTNMLTSLTQDFGLSTNTKPALEVRFCHDRTLSCTCRLL